MPHQPNQEQTYISNTYYKHRTKTRTHSRTSDEAMRRQQHRTERQSPQTSIWFWHESCGAFGFAVGVDYVVVFLMCVAAGAVAGCSIRGVLAAMPVVGSTFVSDIADNE